ncbi:MAG TPA: glycosyltransferase family 39 protein [Terriglobales bacterium]|nr:glycosyltransferase family 39 protein [Terriglobales bacterium]
MLTLSGFCAFLFYFGLGAFGLVGADEPRYAQVAREMLQRQNWVTPFLYGHPWLEKPILYYWQAMVAYKIFGVSDWVARLPSAVDATAMVVAIYLFFRQFRRGFQLDAALITASTAGIIGLSRSASTDMPLAATFTIALVAWLAWYEGGRRRWLLVFYFFLALATLAKGPVAVLLAGVIILLFAVAWRNLTVIAQTLWWPGVLLFLAAALPWYIAVQRDNPTFFRSFILEQNFARFSTNLYHHVQPWWYFVPVLLLAVVPWTFLVVAAFAGAVRRWKREPDVEDSTIPADSFFLTWITVVLVFFSASQSKLPAYILPAVPACAMLLADYLQHLAVAGKRPQTAWLVVHAAMAAGVMGPALLVAYIVLGQGATGQALGIAIVVSAVMLAAILITLAQRGVRVLRFITLVPVILGVALILRLGGSPLDRTQSARPVAQELAAMETTTLPVAVFNATRETEYGLAFYRNQVVSSYNRGEIPAGQHLLVAREGSEEQLKTLLPDRRISHLGGLPTEHLEYFWVSAPGMAMPGMKHQ